MSPKLKLILGAVLISFSAVFVRDSTIPPDTAVFYRVFFGALAYIVYAAFTRMLRLPKKHELLLPFGASVFFAADLFCWHRSIHYLGPGLATLMGNLQVFVIAFVSMIFLREKPKLFFFISVLAGFSGLAMIIGFDYSGHTKFFIPGIILGLLTSFFYAFYILVIREAQKKKLFESSAYLMLLVCIFTSVIAFLYLLFSGTSFSLPGAKNVLDMVLLGFLSQFCGWLLISSSLKEVRAYIASLFLLLQPVLAYVWDLSFFGKPFVYIEAFGALLVLSAIYLGNISESRKNS